MSRIPLKDRFKYLLIVLAIGLFFGLWANDIFAGLFMLFVSVFIWRLIVDFHWNHLLDKPKK